MLFYTGFTKSSTGRRAAEVGWGEVIQPWSGLPTRRFFIDNGAWSDYKAGRKFNEREYLKTLWRIQYFGLTPDFVVLPDVVAGGLESLRLSLEWIEHVEPFGWPMYLVVQNGMGGEHVAPHMGRLHGLFVGGTSDWKWVWGHQWAALAHEYGKGAHCGRVGSPSKVEWAKRAGFDSVDSSAPLRMSWAVDRLDRVLCE